MATFHMLTKLFQTELASPFKAEPADMLQTINIELEELDHDGRRSTEKKRRRYTIKPVAVSLLTD